MNKKLIAGAAGVALLTGVGLSVPMLAQAESATNSTKAAPAAGGTATASTDRHRGHGNGRGDRGIDASALAAKLGLTETTVSDAIAAIRDGQDGANRPSADATQEGKDAARQARQAAFITALAAELNVDEASVSTAVEEIKAEHEATEAAEHTAVLEQAVTDGTLTQVEADAVQKASDAGIVSIRG